MNSHYCLLHGFSTEGWVVCTCMAVLAFPFKLSVFSLSYKPLSLLVHAEVFALGILSLSNLSF